VFAVFTGFEVSDEFVEYSVSEGFVEDVLVVASALLVAALVIVVAAFVSSDVFVENSEQFVSSANMARD